MSAPARPRRAAMDERILERRRAVAAERARRRRRVTASVLVLLVVAAGAVGLSYTPLFAVADVVVRGVEGPRAERVREAAGVPIGTRMLDVDLDRVRADVAAMPWVREVEASREAPSTVSVVVTVREPVAVVRVAGEAWLVGEDGVVVAGGARDGLPVLDAPNSVLPAPGQRVSDIAVRNALAVHAGLPDDVRAAVTRYDAPSDRGLRLHVAGLGGLADGDGVWVRFGLAERVEAKGRVVQLLLEQAHEQARRAGAALTVAEIDVRAPDNPVLVPGS